MSPADTSRRPPVAAYLISGEDAGLASQELSSLLAELEALDAMRGAILEEFRQQSKDDPLPLGAILDSCRTPPFLADRRLIVVRDAVALDAAQQKELVAYVADPVETSVLVVVYAGKTAPAALRKAFSAKGRVIDAQPAGTAKARAAWIGGQLDNAPVRLDGAAAALVREHLGEDLSRLDGIVRSLEAAYGPGATIRVREIEPFLGAAGSVAPWDLTDAIDNGDAVEALSALSRMTGAGERHPLQVLATLHRHFGAMLRLDGREPLTEDDAAGLTGIRGFPLAKVRKRARVLGHDAIATAINLLAKADVDLRGQTGLPPEVVMEILVARLARLERRTAGIVGGAATARRRTVVARE